MVSKVKVLVTQLCPTLCDSVDCSLPGPLSKGFSREESWSGLPYPPPGNLPEPGSNPGLLSCGQILYHLSYSRSPPEERWSRLVDLASAAHGGCVKTDSSSFHPRNSDPPDLSYFKSFADGVVQEPHFANLLPRCKTYTVSGLEHFLKLDFWLRVLIWKNLDASAGGAFETAADSIQKHNKNTSVHTFLNSGANKRKHFQKNSPPSLPAAAHSSSSNSPLGVFPGSLSDDCLQSERMCLQGNWLISLLRANVGWPFVIILSSFKSWLMGP